MPGGLERFVDRSLFDDSTGLQHRDPLAALGGDAEVVGHEDGSERVFTLEGAHESEKIGQGARVRGLAVSPR
jgi:hypothetical protein